MIVLQPDQRATLRHWFRPEVPGLGLVGPHVLATGQGAWYADRWPDPRLVLAQTGANFALRGDMAAFPVDSPPRIGGFVEADPGFLPILERAYGPVRVWPRVLFRLDTQPRPTKVDANAEIRRLVPSDATALARFAPDTAWIADTWGSAVRLAASGFAWGALVNGRLVAAACTFFVGEVCEDVGVATEAPYRGRGYSAACSAALCRDIFARGRIPTWSTSTDNAASIRVAEKLGFTLVGEAELYVVNASVPSAKAG